MKEAHLVKGVQVIPDNDFAYETQVLYTPIEAKGGFLYSVLKSDMKTPMVR